MTRVQSDSGGRSFEARSFVNSERTLKDGAAANRISGFGCIRPRCKGSKEEHLPLRAEEQNTQAHPKDDEAMHWKAIDHGRRLRGNCGERPQKFWVEGRPMHPSPQYLEK